MPCTHNLHADVESFVSQGEVISSSEAFMPAFQTLSTTSVGQQVSLQAFPANLLVTVDFFRTVKATDNQVLDSFLRSVEWVLATGHGDSFRAVIISPYEANLVMPIVRQSQLVSLHVYSARTSLSMRSLNDLSFCTVPAPRDLGSIQDFSLQLNLFAGQMYFENAAEYHTICRFLGLCWQSTDTAIRIMPDGFIHATDRPRFDEAMARICPFHYSPIEVLKGLMAMRRRGQSFLNSHMGKLLYGRLLTEDDLSA